MKLHGLTPVVSLISSAESAEALTLLRSSSYGGSVRRIHPRAHARGLLRRRIKRLQYRTLGDYPDDRGKLCSSASTMSPSTSLILTCPSPFTRSISVSENTFSTRGAAGCKSPTSN